MIQVVKRKRRRRTIAAATVLAVLVLALVAAFYALQTTWFKNQVRQRIIAAIERASGGTIELGEFTYDWRTLTAEFRNVVLHGTETVGDAPLFRSDAIRVRLRIISVLDRDINIASLVMERPQIHVLVKPDGSTNIPSPRLGRRTADRTIEDLLNLKVRHFEVARGVLEVNARSIPLDARGDDTSVLLRYDSSRPAYDVRLSLGHVHASAKQWRSVDAQLDATASLERNRVVIQQARLVSGGSFLSANGRLENFVHPVLDLEIKSQLAAADIARASEIGGLSGGEFSLSGAVHSDESATFTFSGKIAGRRIAYRTGRVALKNLGLQSDVFADPQVLRLTALSLTEPRGVFSGQATFPNYRSLQIDGSLSRLKVQDLSGFFSSEHLPWSGIASGTVHIQSALDRGFRNLVAQTNLQIAAGSNGAPVSGNLDLTYKRPGKVIEFGNSRLNLPRSQVVFSGALDSNLQIALDSSNLDELKPAFSLLNLRSTAMTLPVLLANGTAHFDGTITSLLNNPRVQGNLALAHFRMQGQIWDRVQSRIDANANTLNFFSTTIDGSALHATANGRIGLDNWALADSAALRLQAQFRGADLAKLAQTYTAIRLPVTAGIASGTADVDGSLAQPRGSARVTIDSLNVQGESFNKAQIDGTVSGNVLQITRGRLQAGEAVITFTGGYTRTSDSWKEGELELKFDSNNFGIANFASIRKYESGLNAQCELHATAAARVSPRDIRLKSINGTAVLRSLVINKAPYGSFTFKAATQGGAVTTTLTGDLRGTRLYGDARVEVGGDYRSKGELRAERIDLATLNAILNPGAAQRLPVNGFAKGTLSFEGPLRYRERLTGTAQIEELQVASSSVTQAAGEEHAPDLIFRNTKPILVDMSNGLATIRSFQLGGRDTSLSVNGSIPLVREQSMNLRIDGGMDLRLFQLLDPNLESSGQSIVAGSIRGTLSRPVMNGTLELKNGSLSFKNLPNGLTAVNGTIKFDEKRATIQKLTAESGGGQLSLDGFVAFAKNSPLLYRLEANANNVRLRYANSLSVTASSQLHLSGTSENSIVSGSATVSRVVFNSNTDLGSLLASVGMPAAAPSNEQDFLTGMQFDVRVESAPNLQLDTALSRDVQAEIDLRLRGTPKHPILLGSIQANQGDIRVFGTRYSINRGEVNFVNSVHIEPVLDLDLQTAVRGITVDVTIAGTLGRLNVNYRSDPPLQPRDIIALLTVGRAPTVAANVPTAQAMNDVTALQAGANTLLGQAISPTPGPLARLFGVTNIRIDPFVQGITNPPQARLTVEENISRQITVTYVTNLSQTSEQIFRMEWALSPQYSLVAIRDDNGEFGIDIQYKKRFK